TMYPFATQNAKDYFHLLDVYLDAAFFPLLDELNFKQEGHRLEFEKVSASGSEETLVYKGVVYNEMKGAMSSADQVMGRSLLKGLFPETTYGNNSGGDPAVIPQLTHAQLVAFHQRHYHPSNAYFYTYGDLPLEKLLAFIDEKIMRRFKHIDPKTDVPSHPRWASPKHARFTYPLAPGEEPARKSQSCLAWLTSDIRDTFEVLVMSVLEQILLGNPGSPLRRALMDSGLGSALSDVSGYDADNRDTYFACGLKDIEESAAGEVEKLIMDVLEQLAADGIDKELVDSAIHQIEFHRKEITNSPYPYGLKLLLTVIGTWLHGGDPERVLKLDGDLQHLHQEIAKSGFLEKRLRTDLLDNPHCLHMVLAPDTQQGEREERQLRQELQTRLQRLTEQERIKIKEDAARLQALQEGQEDLSCLPTLAIADIPPDIQTCAPPLVVPGGPIWRYVQSTSDIFYLKLAAGVASMDEALLSWLPFYCYAFHQMGTRRHDYSTMAHRLDMVTGGFSLSAQVRTPFEQPDVCLPMVSLNTKCLTRNITATLDIVEELLGEVLFNDETRLQQL
ncbi:MAG: insulinase family protein, partial [Desulfosarcinaceae bacterium]